MQRISIASRAAMVAAIVARVFGMEPDAAIRRRAHELEVLKHLTSPRGGGRPARTNGSQLRTRTLRAKRMTANGRGNRWSRKYA